MNRAVLLLSVSLALAASATAHAAELPGSGGILGGLPPLSSADLADLAAGGPLVLTRFEATEGATAQGAVTTGPDGTVAIRSHAQASATITGSPVTLTGGAAVSTGGFNGAVTMENSAGVATLQMASGFNNVQQSAVSSAFVLSGLPQF